MIRLKILNSYYRVIDHYYIRQSSREVKFSSLKIDFTGKGIQDLPLKYQEVQLLDLDDDNNVNEIIYTGYVNNFVLPKMKNKIEYRELEIDLISPLAMATVRTADAVGTYNLKDLVKELVQPLIEDGFVLKELDIGENQITVNYLNETIESALNKLSNKFNFWWYIDKNKNIYINSIDYLISRQPKLIYDDDNSIKGLIDLIPSIDATDYCNTINFTNVRVFTSSSLRRQLVYDGIDIVDSYYTRFNPLTNITEIKQGDEIEFDIPFDITIDNYNESIKQMVTSIDLFVAQLLSLDEQTVVNVRIYVEDDKLVLSNNLSIEESYGDSNTFVFVRDSFFTNLIVGMKYNGTTTLKVNYIETPVALMWSKIKVMNNSEVGKNKNIISQTGIVEKQIDMNEQWKFYDELLDIANSYIKINNSRVEQVILTMDEKIDLNIGDTIKINKEDFLINDTYIITDKNIYYDDNIMQYEFYLKNTNILENYVDLFRASEQEETDRQFNLITSCYSEDENIKEIYEVVEL